MSGLLEHLNRLRELRDAAHEKRKALLDRVEAEGRTELNKAETTEWRRRCAHIDELDELIAEQTAEVERSGRLDPAVAGVRARSGRVDMDGGGGGAGVRGWAQRAANAIQAMGGDARAMTSGQVDVPNLVEPSITGMARPDRLIDLLVNRKELEGNVFEYFRQTVRTNNAAPVADSAAKPVSVFTSAAVTDRARVIAHLAEPAPLRLLWDVEGLLEWLVSELAEGVLDRLERSVIQGNGTSEDVVGLLNVAGTRAVPFATDVPTTLRKALTTLQIAGEKPNAMVLHPTDAENVDLLRWGASGGFLTGGFANDPGVGFGTSSNIFGPSEIQRVISPSAPVGTGIVGDWKYLRLYVREMVNVQFDLGGDLFKSNQFQGRGEGRFGLGILRPSAFAVVDLTA